MRSRCRRRGGRTHRSRIVDRAVHPVGSTSSPRECPLDARCRPRDRAGGRDPRRHGCPGGGKVKGENTDKILTPTCLDVSRAPLDLRQGGLRKSRSGGFNRRVGHCLCVGQGEESLSRQGRGAPGIGPGSTPASLREETNRPSISSGVIERKCRRDVRKVGFCSSHPSRIFARFSTSGISKICTG